MNKIKKNGFVEGTMIAYIAIIITKLIGAFYSIPFYNIIGERGGVIYSCAYNIYNLFLSISTSGIPTAMSIIISEYNSLKMFKAKEKTQRVARNTVFIISIIAFAVLFFAASLIGEFFLGEESGPDATLAIRTVAFCLLIVPFLSIKRGYLQGHTYISPSSVSQVIEQFVRVFVILVGSYVAINVLNLSTAIGVSTALTGAFFGALIAYIYISLKIRKNRSAFLPEKGDVVNNYDISTSETLKKITRICIPLIIVSISTNIYDITDMKLVMIGLSSLKYSVSDSQVIASIIATWGPKICMMINALAMGLTSSLVPHMVSSYVKDDFKGTNKKFNQAIGTVLMIALPMAVGMCMLSSPLYNAFYGQSEFGPILMKILPFVSVMASIGIVSSMSLQSIGMARTVCFTNVTGLVINAILDVPFIYLFNILGLPAYLGAAFSSIIGYTVQITAVFLSLKKKLRFRYKALARLSLKIFISLVCMIIIVLIMKMFIPIYTGGRVIQFVWLMCFAVVGGGAYFLCAFKLGAIEQVFGKDFLNKILKKLHFKK